MEFHATETEAVLANFNVTKDGLTASEVASRIEKYGPNSISGKHRRTILDIVADQFKNFILILLIAAVVVSILIGREEDAIGIGIAITLSVVFGFILEFKADESMRALQAMQSPKAIVVRDGKTKVIGAIELVPGDLIQIEEGEKVPADCRIISEANFHVNEAALTGESVSVLKSSKVVKLDAPISERTNMIYSGTFVVQGRSTAIVTSTGDETELGKIASKLSEIESEETVLQKSLDQLGKRVSIASVIVIFIFFAIGLIQERQISELFVLSISLVVAAVPEGLLTVLTIILAIGVKRMANNNALIRKLNAVETVGNASVVVVDKTGTITRGKMTLAQLYFDGKIHDTGEVNESNKLLRYAAYCNSARITDKGIMGDEVDKAILHSADALGINIHKIKNADLEVFHPLDSSRKRMSIALEIDGSRIGIVKGAPETILELSTAYENEGRQEKLTQDEKESIAQEMGTLTRNGMRVLGLGYKLTDAKKEQEIEKNLIFLGLLAFNDPPREEIYETLKITKNAGINVIMLTGDNLQTAMAIGKQIGLIEKDDEAVEWISLEKNTDEQICERLKKIKIIARATPLSKLKVVEMLIASGEVVTVTGDGVNDALALKKAHVGVVMGSGTDVSKEAGNLVLLDDNLATLITAISYGRTIFNNIINFIRFQFTTNLAMLLLFFISFFANLPYMLTPIQILFINIVMDGPPALALGFEKPVGEVLDEKPRKNKSILSKNLALSIVLSSLFMVIITISVFYYYNSHDQKLALTMTFVVFVLMQLFNTLNCRFVKEHFYSNITSNKYIVASIVVLFFVLVGIVNETKTQQLFEIREIPVESWAFAMLAACSILVFEEIKKEILTKVTDY